VVGGGHFGSKTVVGHGIGHKDATLGVDCVVCTKHRDFDKTNRNANYLSAVIHQLEIASNDTVIAREVAAVASQFAGAVLRAYPTRRPEDNPIVRYST
jgi:hypothetical protein